MEASTLDRLKPSQARALALAVAAAIGWVDLATGYEIRVFPLYFLPVALTAWRLGWLDAVGLAALSAGVWGWANWRGEEMAHPVWVWGLNLVVQLLAFLTVAGLIVRLRRSLDTERRLSRVDPLTGLLNTRAFLEQGKALAAGSARAGRPLTLAYLDLDHFKAVNDRHGHAEGDRVLALTAEHLKRSLRAGDLVARLGGDEFALLLPDADEKTAQILLERLRSGLNTEMRRLDRPVSISVGALTFSRAPMDLNQAVTSADALMYRAKAAGRDRVYVERA